MLPAQRNKVDISKLSPQEQQLFAKYGKLPTHKNVLTKMQKDRKYFDSGDYALSKAGKAPQNTVGTAIPNPENIPHASTPGNGHSNGHTTISISPTNSISKESGLATDQNTTPPVEGEPAQDPEGVVAIQAGVTVETKAAPNDTDVISVAETVVTEQVVAAPKAPE
ncbi:Endosulfine-domain-containing protein [Coprinopsis marcescibilis]|uniref:mRNA stability protein n=1 Tax=Coprinopsis marcescibilis TaxID=230819 RepID=A0A5C3KJW4_COPMA|nr:Endosulfine-domain-containing protein [Coprinopsis marcescibilis]